MKIYFRNDKYDPTQAGVILAHLDDIKIGSLKYGENDFYTGYQLFNHPQWSIDDILQYLNDSGFSTLFIEIREE